MLISILVPALCHAEGCRTMIESAALHAAIGGGHGCSQIVTAKLCAPAGKTIISSGIKDVNVSPTLAAIGAVGNAGTSCIEAKVTVRARVTLGPVFWESCDEGAYEGRAELAYCR